VDDLAVHPEDADYMQNNLTLSERKPHFWCQREDAHYREKGSATPRGYMSSGKNPVFEVF
jgi:hypothetical protein